MPSKWLLRMSLDHREVCCPNISKNKKEEKFYSQALVDEKEEKTIPP